MFKINTEFRKGIMFVRINGNLNKSNINTIFCEDFKYIVFNFDNLLSIDSYSIKYIINYNNIIKNNNGKLIICDSNNNLINNLFNGIIPIIDNEIKAFNIL